MARITRTFLPLVAVCLLSGCNGDTDRAAAVVVIGEPGSPFGGGPRYPAAAQLVRSATAEGLVAFDEQGRAVPALADRWIVTDDGLSYIFRLRDGSWADGSELTGDSVKQALTQAFAALSGGALAGDLAAVDEIRAMAGRVIEIRLKQQMPDLLQVLAQPELGLIHSGHGAGPMRLSRKGAAALLKPIPPEDRGLPQQEDWAERVRSVRLIAQRAQKAIAAFNKGEADVVLGGGFADFPRLDASGVPRGAIRFDPVAGLFGLAVVHGDGFLSQAENREALAMALDRDALGEVLNVGGWTATTRIINPGLTGDGGAIGERWAGRSLEERRATAAARVSRWKAARRGPTKLRLALPAGPGADALFKQLQADFTAIGLATERVGESAEADLRLVDNVARYARAAWFLNQLSCSSAHGLCDGQADRLVASALAEPDAAKRADIYAEAEARLTITNSFIPFGVPIRWSLVGGNVTGFAINRLNVHPLMPLAFRPK